MLRPFLWPSDKAPNSLLCKAPWIWSLLLLPLPSHPGPPLIPKVSSLLQAISCFPIYLALSPNTHISLRVTLAHLLGLSCKFTSPGHPPVHHHCLHTWPGPLLTFPSHLALPLHKWPPHSLLISCSMSQGISCSKVKTMRAEIVRTYAQQIFYINYSY